MLTILTRLPFTSKLLYHMDSCHFALALENYDVTIHQPHPPGYFLYVMLGRLINLFVQDANTTFISISIFFSSLAVVTIYLLGKEVFNRRTGVFAALIALTSPNLWFHGEVALTYVVEAFFSSFVALLCWKMLKGEHKYLWLSVIALGIAGGIRQNTIVFLFPLWIFSVKGIPFRKIAASLGLLIVVCSLWFVPMVWMTGGWNAYNEALKELWEFNTGHVSVFEKGWDSLKVFSSTLFDFVFYGIGAGLFILGLGAYSLIRYGNVKNIDISKTLFFLLWILPPTLFYLLIFIHPANPGYILIFLPPFFLLITAAIVRISNDIKTIFHKDIAIALVAIVVTVNSVFFLFSKYPVSNQEIKTHDKTLAAIFSGIEAYNPFTTAIFVGPYIFYGYRQIMYYLPQYTVYQVDVRVLPTGETRKTFWGKNRQTFLSDIIRPSPGTEYFIAPIFLNDLKNLTSCEGLDTRELLPELYLISGPLRIIQKIYPELNIHLQDRR
jgi:hypothetical protein